MMLSETPGRTSGPGLLLDESANNGMLPPGAVSSAVTVTFCPSLNIGSREGAAGTVGLAAGWGGGTNAGAAGATAAVEEVPGVEGAEAMLLGLGAACGVGAGGAVGVAGAAGVEACGFGLTVICGGGVLSPK